MNILRLLIPIFLISIIELYIFVSLRNTFINNNSWQNIRLIYIIILVFYIIGISIFTINIITNNIIPSRLNNIICGTTISILIGKIFLSIFFLSSDIFRILKNIIWNHSFSNISPHNAPWIFIGISIATIIAIWGFYSTIWGRYDFKIRTEKLTFADLPEKFDGFRIVQISDLHSGSLDNLSKMRECIELINQQQPDVILFTGDIVTYRSKEMLPLIDIYKQLNARNGKFCILGNHDYAPYSQLSDRERLEDIQLLHKLYNEIGFAILDNRSVELRRDKQKIYIAGVENWGNPPFPQYGNLEKALQFVDTSAFTILMSHDPSHWEAQILQNNHRIALTLSGHTHGMQMGIDLPFFRWSPVKWKYPHWAGLYSQNNHYLYVNRGIGCTLMPIRIGIRPEITVIELHKF